MHLHIPIYIHTHTHTLSLSLSLLSVILSTRLGLDGFVQQRSHEPAHSYAPRSISLVTSSTQPSMGGLCSSDHMKLPITIVRDAQAPNFTFCPSDIVRDAEPGLDFATVTSVLQQNVMCC